MKYKGGMWIDSCPLAAFGVGCVVAPGSAAGDRAC